MPAYRFSWDLFDERTVGALARDIGFVGPASEAPAFLKSRVIRPNDDFVQRTKKSLATVWLPQHGGIGEAIVRELFDAGIGPMGPPPTDAAGFARYVDRCRNSSGLRGRILDRLLSFGDRDKHDSYEPDGDFVPRFGVVVPGKHSLTQTRPYPHQADAWAAMDRHLAAAKATGVFKGVVVMPTGAGKTRTAVHWLMRQWVKDGGHVLWIAHRDELLRQAARSFYDSAALAHGRERLRLRLVSGRHCGFHQIDPADDIVLCSVHSLARAGQGVRSLLTSGRLFVVIDEAHHAPARSYREVIGVLEQEQSHYLLGLTATPTRTAESERPELARLFGRNVIYQVTAAELVAREILARPVPSTVRTGVDAEAAMTTEDVAHLRDFHELSPAMRARLGTSAGRNTVIAQHYAANHNQFGKTLVFAPDVEGAAMLTEVFRAHLPEGIEAEYLASYRPDGSERDRRGERELLERFRNSMDPLRVLVNVDMLTEGVDLPITQTVFLARPTSSEILLRQMVGRALRGPSAGGHREAYVVSFEDHWSTFRDVLSPIDLLADDVVVATVEETMAAPTSEIPIEEPLPPISWNQVLELSRAIRAAIPDPDVDVFEAIPHGMFCLDYVVDDEPVRHYVHVYEHQKSCWDALFKYLSGLSASSLSPTEAEDLLQEFFGDCDDPLPSTLDVATVLERARHGDAVPVFIPLVGRQACDPREIARHASESDLRDSEIDALLTERHSPLARVLYPTPLDFRRAFDDAMRELKYPAAAAPPKGTVIFEAPPSNPLRPGPYHDLKRLMAEMLETGSGILGQSVAHDGPVFWSKRIIKGWFGVAHHSGPRAGQIRMNRLLDSPDVSAGTLRFLLWHEFLHLYLRQGHTPEFRRWERHWPHYAACEREMDNLNERFGVQYW